MMKHLLLSSALLLASFSVVAQDMSHADHAEHEAQVTTTAAIPRQPTPAPTATAAPAPAPTPAPQPNWAKPRVEASPRHREWVSVKAGNRTVSAFVVYPEVKSKATAVVVIHEIFGMSDWVQLLADELAEAGYIAIAPDLLSGAGPKGGGTSDFADGTAVGKAIRDLPPDQITADLNAVTDYVKKLPAANGKVAVTGYCWGGTQSFRFATNRPDLAAAFIFYGSGPEDPEAIARIKAPVYGFYAGNDARIGATLPKTQELMAAAKKTFEPVTYEGAGHGFMRAGDGPPPPAEAPQAARDGYPANKKARDDAWTRWKGILSAIQEGKAIPRTSQAPLSLQTGRTTTSGTQPTAPQRGCAGVELMGLYKNEVFDRAVGGGVVEWLAKVRNNTATTKIVVISWLDMYGQQKKAQMEIRGGDIASPRLDLTQAKIISPVTQLRLLSCE